MEKGRIKKILMLTFSLLISSLFIILLFYSRTPKVFSFITPNPDFTREARYWTQSKLGVQCLLCPNYCFLTEGAKGKCRVRMNKDSSLYTQTYNQPVTFNIDPIEKKPIFHMLPGSSIFSFSTVGCPLKCSFCQNWTLSQAYPENTRIEKPIYPEAVVEYAVKSGTKAIAYTYGEPVAFYEYMLDIAKLAKEHGLRNVMITSGYINPEPLREIAPYFDVIKVDLKGITEDFYRKDIKGYLQGVLTALKVLKETGVFIEVVNLVVPTRNDSEKDLRDLSDWVYTNLGPDTPLFFSRFSPAYKLSHLPPTPVATLEKARRIAMERGLNFVYVGNVSGHESENTYCPNDKTILIERHGYHVKKNILKEGRCPVCGRKIPGIW